MNVQLKIVGLVLGVSLGWQGAASAGWVLTVTGGTSSEAASTVIPRTDMNNANLSSAGNLQKLLGQQNPNYSDAYYAANVYVGNLKCSANQKSSGVSASISGSKEWKWVWDGNPNQDVNEYAWDYSVKGMADAYASVDLDDNGGYGKIEAGSWVKVEADSLNSTPQASSVAVGAGAEVRADGEALTGIGIEASANGGGISLAWTSGGTQLEAYQSVTEYVTLSEIVRPGNECWVKVHTSASATVGAFHDTDRHGNECSGFSGIQESYPLLKLEAPHFSP